MSNTKKNIALLGEKLITEVVKYYFQEKSSEYRICFENNQFPDDINTDELIKKMIASNLNLTIFTNFDDYSDLIKKYLKSELVKVPAIVITGYSEDFIRRFQPPEYFFYVEKPIRFEEFTNKIKSIFSLEDEIMQLMYS
jgi:hypothetical protein